MRPETPYHALLDGLNTAVLLVSPDMAVEYANSAAEALLEIGFVKLKGTQVCALFADAKASREAMQEALATNQTYTKRQESIRNHGSDSRLVDYSVVPTQLFDSHWLIIEMQTIDQFLRINQKEALTSLQDSSRSLIRGLAHEIKNPLGGIRGAAQLLNQELSERVLGSEPHELCKIIITEVDRLRNLVDRLLGPNQLPVVKRINVHEVVDHVCNLVDAETQGRITLKLDYDPSIPDIHGDREQLIQALLNIARNAMQVLQYAARSVPTITFKTRVQQNITIAGVRQKIVCRLDVADNGPGIDPAIKERIFLPMISGHGEGTGLGLTIAETAVNRHGGIIECRSTPGETVFSVFLPIKV